MAAPRVHMNDIKFGWIECGTCPVFSYEFTLPSGESASHGLKAKNLAESVVLLQAYVDEAYHRHYDGV